MARNTIIRSLSLDADLVEWAQRKANEDMRSLSNFVNTMLRRIKDKSPSKPKRVKEFNDYLG